MENIHGDIAVFDKIYDEVAKVSRESCKIENWKVLNLDKSKKKCVGNISMSSGENPQTSSEFSA